MNRQPTGKEERNSNVRDSRRKVAAAYLHRYVKHECLCLRLALYLSVLSSHISRLVELQMEAPTKRRPTGGLNLRNLRLRPTATTLHP